MAACGSLQHIFESPLPENPTFIESLTSWNKIKPIKPPIEQSSLTEIFGELHFKESSSATSPLPLSSSSSSFFTDINTQPAAGSEKLTINKSTSLDSFSNNKKGNYTNGHKNSDSFSSMNSESLQLCTEGLGFESCDDVEDLNSDISNNNWIIQEEDKEIITTKHYPPSGNSCGEIIRRSPRRSNGSGPFPPPISCIGKTGKPWVCFKSYRHDGRFVLKEVRIPTQEFLHACREDGRLKLHFVQPEDELLEEDDEEEDEEEEEVNKMGNEDDEKESMAEIREGIS